MKDVVNENIKIENEGVSVEISDNSTQINIDRRLSKKDVNRLLGFIEILMAESEKNAHSPNYRNRNIHDKEGKPNATAS